MPRPLKLLYTALVAVVLLAGFVFYRAHTLGEKRDLAVSPPPPAPASPPTTASGPFLADPSPTSTSAHRLSLDEVALTTAIIRERPAPEVSAPHQTRSDLPASERVYLAANERIQIPLSRAAQTARQPITLRADHGGLLNGEPLTPQVELPASAASFSFQAGGTRGLYHVTVQQGANVEILEFWVGEPSPLGRPGPARNILPPVATTNF